MIKTYSTKTAAEKAVKLSANFTVGEFASKDGYSSAFIDEQLVKYLQKIRDHFGKPVTISSGYRSPSHNKAVGGASNSLHTKGQAADIYISGVEPAEIAKYAESLGILGIGLYTRDRFVHVDTRTTKYFWTNAGTGEKSVSTHGGKSFARIVQEKAGLSDATMDYLRKYKYGEDLIEKLASAMGG